MHIMPQSTLDALSRFQAALQAKDGSRHTIQGYVSDVRLFARWFHQRRGESNVIQDVLPVDIQAYRDHLIDILRRKPATTNRHIQSLRRFFRFAQREAGLKSNPAEGIRTVREQKRLRPLSLTQDETQQMLSAAGRSAYGNGPRNYAILQLFLQSGLRVSELTSLVGGDVEIGPRGGSVSVRSGKGIRSRVVPLNAPCRRGLLRYFDIRDVPAPSEPVFLSNRAKAISARSVQYVVESCAKSAGIDRLKVGAHSLRHTFATRYLDANPGDLVSLAALLSHESIETTAIYVRPSADDLAASIKRAAQT